MVDSFTIADVVPLSRLALPSVLVCLLDVIDLYIVKSVGLRRYERFSFELHIALVTPVGEIWFPGFH